MKIAILTSGILPVPAVQGGAVEKLIDFYLEYNNSHQIHDITIYSITHPKTQRHEALKSEVNHYYYIDTQSRWARLRKKAYQKLHKAGYYHYSIEYYLHQALKHIAKQHYDLIILENRPGYALKLKNVTNASIVYHLHNDLLNSQTLQGDQIYQLADRIITVSNYIGHCVKTINPSDTKCVTAYNGIDVEFYGNGLEKKNEKLQIRKKLGLTEDDFVISFSGRIIPEKGILPLIQAMRQIREHHDIKLIVLGGFSLGDSNEQTPFQQEIQEATDELNNIIFTGYVPYNEMGKYLKMADIAVLPSMWEEPFGLTVVEAMAAGLPLITTRSGGIPEICKGIATIVERENIVNNLTDAILDLYQHPEKRQAMSCAALKHASYFNKERYSKDFFNALCTKE